MKISKRTIITFVILILVVLSLTGGVIKFFYSAVIEKCRYEGIKGIAIALTVYANDYETLPPIDNWCDKLIEEADCHPRVFVGWINREEGKCGYAINEKLDGLSFSELDDKAVLAFEAKGEWNLSGGQELAKQSKQEIIAVVFVDGYMDFIKTEDIDNLRWGP